MRQYAAGLLAVAVLVSGCTGGADTDPVRKMVHTYELGNGAQLVAPAGAFSGDVDIAGGPVAEALLDLSGFPSAGAVEVTASEQPDRPVTVEIPIDPAAYADLPVGADDAILVAHRHADEDWDALTGQLDRTRSVVTVTTQRLSVFDVRLPSLAGLRAQVGAIVDGIFGDINFHTNPPRCTREQEAREAGYRVTSTRTSVLRWCLGLRQDGSPQLKVVANRRYPLVAVLGQGLSVRENTAGELGVRLAQAATSALRRRQVTLSPDGTTTLDVGLDPGQRSRLVADFDGFAQSLVSLQVAADVMIQMASLTRGGLGRTELMDATLDTAACAPRLLDLAGDVGDEGRVGATVAACFDADALASTLGKVVAYVVLKVANFIGSVIAYVWNSAVAGVDNVRGSSRYVIAVERASSDQMPSPGCDTDAYASALCRVVMALVSGDRSELTDGERLAVSDVTTVPTTSWRVEGCQPVGDISAECLVHFQRAAGAADATEMRFTVQPVNGEYDAATGQYIPPEGQPIRYEVVAVEGYGP